MAIVKVPGGLLGVEDAYVHRVSDLFFTSNN